jgi:hypothetical protein
VAEYGKPRCQPSNGNYTDLQVAERVETVSSPVRAPPSSVAASGRWGAPVTGVSGRPSRAVPRLLASAIEASSGVAAVKLRGWSQPQHRLCIAARDSIKEPPSNGERKARFCQACCITER